MKPPPFDYLAPTALDEALALLADLGDAARPLAGGQSLVPMLNFRLVRPRHLVDLNGIAELSGIREQDGRVAIGAMTRQRALEQSPLVRRRCPLLADALPHVGHVQIRNRGTIGGSLAHADPAAELPAVAVALDAQLVLRRAGGERLVPAEAFFTGWFTTALAPDELLVEVRLPPLPRGAGTAFVEVARRHGDFALVAAAAVVVVRDGTVAGARVALAGVGAAPVRLPAAEREAEGQPVADETFRSLAAAIAAELDPPSDLHADAVYRRRVAAVVAERALRRAAERARG